MENIKKNSYKILIVDDDPDFSEATKAILESSGYKVLVASDAEEGLDKAKIDRPDLIILDVILPDKEGFSICRELKEAPETVDIPVLILTSITDKADKNNYAQKIAKNHKADGFLSKPVEKDELLSKLDDLLKSKIIISIPEVKRKILLIDEDTAFSDEVESVLGSENMEILLAGSGIEGIKMAQAFLPDLIIIEAMLPDRDGYSVCYELKKNKKTYHIPIIMVSKIDKEFKKTEYAAQIARGHLADDFITKPIDSDKIIEEVSKYI